MGVITPGAQHNDEIGDAGALGRLQDHIWAHAPAGILRADPRTWLDPHLQGAWQAEVHPRPGRAEPHTFSGGASHGWYSH